MIKLAFNKINNDLVFTINKVERVAVGGAGIKEYYVGTLIDTSTVPDVHTENFKVQVKAFESDWEEVPIGVSGTSTVNNQEKTVTPSASQQVVTPSTNYTGLSKVTVEATPLETASVTPSVSEQTVTPTGTGKIGLSSVTVAAVTAAIDANIVAGNIKNGVTILGVTGSYTGQ